MKFETLAIHVGQAPDTATGATIVPVYQTVTFTQDAIGEDRGFVYSRSGNPTRSALEICIAALEGARFSYVDATRPETIAKALLPAPRMVWIESPTNPMLRLIDVAACAEIARAHGAWLVVDNTFATPDLCDDLLQALAQCG